MDLGKIIAFNLNRLRTERSLTLGAAGKTFRYQQSDFIGY